MLASVDGSEIPSNHRLDVSSLVNSEISTTVPSTGEFAGFLNHQQYHRFDVFFPGHQECFEEYAELFDVPRPSNADLTVSHRSPQFALGYECC